MQPSVKTYLHITFAFLALGFLCVAGVPQNAYAACIGGIPCVTNKTPDPDHFDNIVEPNVAGNPNASKSSSAACDADFMNQIYGRALLEAERETVMAQVVIRKSDSVLDYSCFEETVSNTGSPLGAVFSDAEGDLSSILSSLVLDAFTEYTKSFNYHSFIGGLSPDSPLDPGCPRMNSIFMLAQCNDMAVDDPFLKFSQFAAPLDPRSLPTACSAGDTMIETGIIEVAENKDFNHVSFDEVTYNYLDRLLIGGSLSCDMPPIPTGHMLTREIKTISSLGKVSIGFAAAYAEHVCSNPSCFYNQASGECE